MLIVPGNWYGNVTSICYNYDSVMLIIPPPVLSSSKLMCKCGVLAGLFLAMDFQLNDIYLCRGRVRTSPATDGGVEGWSKQEHALWTIVYAGALFVYTLAWMKMEHLLANTVSEG